MEQCSQKVDVNGPHHGPYQLMASSSLHCHRLVEWGRHNELEASMVGAVYVHVLRTLVWRVDNTSNRFRAERPLFDWCTYWFRSFNIITLSISRMEIQHFSEIRKLLCVPRAQITFIRSCVNIVATETNLATHGLPNSRVKPRVK